MPRAVWPEGSTGRQPRFGDVFRSALGSLRGYQIEDRFGVYFRAFHEQHNGIVMERFVWRELPLSGLSGWDFLSRHDPEELARVCMRMAPPGMLVVTVLAGPHPRGTTVPPNEERAIFERLGIPVPHAHG